MLAVESPLMMMSIVGPEYRLNPVASTPRECAVAQGTYGLSVPDSKQQIEYKIALLFYENYPKQMPTMFCNDPKLPIGNIDRHILNDGSACLGVYGDIAVRWSKAPNIVNFLRNLVAPFLTWQVHHDVFQTPPPWGQRSHFAKGIIEFYAELFEISVDDDVAEFMKLLARKNRPKGHERCPCGSDKRLRDCHRGLIYNARQKVAWQYVARDLQMVRRNNQTKA